MLGLPFSYAHFFAIEVEDGPAIVEGYRRHFRPSAYLSAPRVGIGVHVVCAETEAAAQRLASSRNLSKLKSALGQRGPVPSVETALAYHYRPQELAYMAQFSRAHIDGTPQQVKAGLDAIAAQYQTTDISIVTICHGFAERVRSYELVAEVCGLKPPTASTTSESVPVYAS
jgi:alkanesulfonate monooxygenase SsuD/methylene tetrahydromethanopterin reductase-like flavin-dependent oxidoreductase (luciferase family)